MKLVVTFHTTSDAMAMEKVCKERNVPGRLIPVPRAISAGCGLSWCADLTDREQILDVMKEVGIDQFAWGHDARGGDQRLDVVVATMLVGSGRNRLHADGFHAQSFQREKQRAGDEGLADFGIGAGDEVSGLLAGCGHSVP